jgi:phenylacetate-CoA ligase
MHERMLALYHQLPAPVRSVAATLRGAYLNRWRYGPRSEDLVAATLERDAWTPQAWATWREERLAALLERAATRVPWYRDHWERRRRRGDRASPELLANWPILDKETVRADPRAFVADDRDPRRMFHERTSGTTGKPLDLWRSRDAVELLYALCDARTLAWFGIARPARYARLGGQLVTPVRQRRPPFWVWNAAMRQLYMSTFHLAPDLVGHYLDALHEYRIDYLAGYPSSLVILAQQALRLGRNDLRMRAVFTNAEPLCADQRETVAAAFHCPVVETYGMAEAVAFASECPAGRLHQWPEAGVIEVLDGDRPVAPGETGDFVCTGLLNTDMPLVRYRVGDRGRLAPDEPCACGRALPAIGAVEGRETDLLLTRDGREIFWLNPVFYGLPIRQAQIVQEALGQVTVLLVPGDDFSPEDAATIEARLRERLGDVAVTLRRVGEVPRTSAGKIRAVVCHVPREERAAVLARAAAAS